MKLNRRVIGQNNYWAQFKMVAVNPKTGMFLHLSGSGETRDRDYAWVGTRTQFGNISLRTTLNYELETAQE